MYTASTPAAGHGLSALLDASEKVEPVPARLALITASVLSLTSSLGIHSNGPPMAASARHHSDPMGRVLHFRKEVE